MVCKESADVETRPGVLDHWHRVMIEYQHQFWRLKKYIEVSGVSSDILSIRGYKKEEKKYVELSYAPMLMEDLPESYNKKIVFLQEDVLKILDLLEYLIENKIEPIIFKQEKGVLTIEGGDQSFSAPYRRIRYDWEEEQEKNFKWVRGTTINRAWVEDID